MMTDQITVTLPEELTARVRQLAAATARPVEQVVLEHLATLAIPLPALPPDEQAELDALQRLSDDALWTIASEQLPAAAQARAHDLMTRNTRGALTEPEAAELEALVRRADRVMLRKAEAAAILRARGYEFTQADFQANE